MPYWDWTLDAHDLMSSPIFDSDPVYGLGGSGDCTSNDCHVLDGGFSTHNPSAHQSSFPSLFVLSYPTPHPLRRNLTLLTGWFEHEIPANSTLTNSHVKNVMRETRGDFVAFQRGVTRMHNSVHNFIGGDLAGTCPEIIDEDICRGSFSSNEPLFWLHHAQMDRLWSKWQNLHPENYYTLAPICERNCDMDSVSVNHLLQFDRLGVPVRVQEVFDHTVPPFCYVYR
jgi:tyrosinase